MDTLPGLEAGTRTEHTEGRRRERIEWAVKYPAMPGVYAAGTAPAEDRAHAEEMADNGGPGYRVVCRTVVTYTTDWRAPRSSGRADR